VVLAIAYQRGVIASLLNRRPLVLLGNASFALSLVPQLLLGFVYTHRDQLLDGVPDVVQCVGYWVIAFAAAFALWKFV
jgi:peptidoglycan/LPS O-acetylase OafA/YrhL